MIFAAVIAILPLGAQGFLQNPPKRRIPCKTPENAALCYWTRGRLQEHEGTPAYRLWKIGTHHVLGIYSGPGATKSNTLDNEDPEFPANVRTAMKSGVVQVFADFEVCPLEPERRGSMQSACIESGKKLFVKK